MSNTSVASIGVDVHQKFSTVAMSDADGRVLHRRRLEHSDREALRREFRQWPAGVPAVLEASFGWGWLSDVMDQEGIDVRLSNCYKVEQMRKARGMVKTNEKDAALLSLLPLEPTPWWEVWRAPADVRNAREWMRYRADMVELQTKTKNRIHAIFHRHGIYHEFSDLFGAGGRAFLAQLCRDGHAALPDGALAALRGHVRLLQNIRTQLAEVAHRLHRRLQRDRLTRCLDSVPGIGMILAHVIQAEVGRIERFRNHKALASYALLAPRSDDSGEANPRRAPKGRHLGNRGNKTLKWAFVEAAHGAVRKGGKWRAMYDRHTDGGRKNCGRGYIKVARELVKVVYAVWRKEIPYDPNPARQAGRGRLTMMRQKNKKRRRTRSGTGQLNHPMVVAG